MTRSVDFAIRNDLADIAVVRDALDRLGGEFAVPERALMHLQVALDEVVSNVVKYAWPDGGAHELRIRFTVRAAGMVIDVFDDGVPFDPRNLSEPAPVSPGRRPRPGGVGVHMIWKLVDEFAYERIDGCNHTSLTKNFPVSARVEENEK